MLRKTLFVAAILTATFFMAINAVVKNTTIIYTEQKMMEPLR